CFSDRTSPSSRSSVRAPTYTWPITSGSTEDGTAVVIRRVPGPPPPTPRPGRTADGTAGEDGRQARRFTRRRVTRLNDHFAGNDGRGRPPRAAREPGPRGAGPRRERLRCGACPASRSTR